MPKHIWCIVAPDGSAGMKYRFTDVCCLLLQSAMTGFKKSDLKAFPFGSIEWNPLGYT